jgi:hypothetical protein
MKPPVNPYRYDAEACGAFVRLCIEGKRKGYRDMPVEVIVWAARWAGHWGLRAMEMVGRG